MSVTLRKRENKDFTTSLYLDIYHNGKRYKEFLKECKQVKVVSPADRSDNKNKLNLAKEIRAKKEIELGANDENIIPKHRRDVDFNAYFKNYIDTYNKKDKRNIVSAYNRFVEFQKTENLNITNFKQLTENIIQNFADYLLQTSKGEGVASCFKRFKRVLKKATKEKIMLGNPAADVTIKNEGSLTKDILTIEEIQKLADVPVTNNEVKRAFLFCCFTGLRWVDVKAMQGKHIDFENKLLSMVQAKTEIKVSVTLNKTALSLLPANKTNNEFVFTLPSHNGALKTLRNWLKKAGINKHITWHCARHSFATNLLVYDNDVLIVSKLLGHKTLKYTQRYTHIANDLKMKATDKLPVISI